jgi:hypothetical protein
LTHPRSDPASIAPTGIEESPPVREAVTLSRQGSREAVHFLYTRYAPDVHSGVRDLVRDDREAQAVTESVFRELVGLVDGYEPSREPFGSWLLSVARDAAQEHAAGRPFPRNSRLRLVGSPLRRK